MEAISRQGTPKTPSIEFDPVQGLLEIKGRSNPENTMDFYRPLVAWLDEYIQNPAEQTIVNVHLEHFNTSSSKSILELFKALDPLHKEGKEIVVNWFYEDDDEDILEAGENYESITRLPFRMVAI
ncbi:DUF1987 domain-containing protein [Bacteroidota bacterium]